MFKENTIACIDPFYPGLVDVVKLTGKQPAFFNQNNWLNTLNTLPKGSLFYLSADFANPTGNCLSIDERLHLVNTARERDFYIFDDATYRPFNLTKALPSLVSLAPDRVFHAQSFSKVLAPGLRIAFIHVPESFKNGFLTIKAILSLNSPGTTQAIVGGWLILNDFKFQKHLEGFKEELKHKKAILGKQGINYSGGFFAELHFEGVTIDYNWCASLLAVEGVAVCPMQMFSKQKSFQHSLRVAIARISITILEEGLMKIHKFTQS
jgi:DNA-binding transcriptional MocR family regulator